MGKTGKLRVKKKQQQQGQQAPPPPQRKPPVHREEAGVATAAAAAMTKKKSDQLQHMGPKRKNPFDLLSTDSTGDEVLMKGPAPKKRKGSIHQAGPASGTLADMIASGHGLQMEPVESGSMHGEYALISTEKQGMAAMHYIRAHRVLVVDCEGSKLGRAGTLTLVQVSTPTRQAFLFDVLTPELKKLFFDKCGLRKVLESKNYLKVFHDCRSDSDALFHHANVRLQNVFDTQVAHALMSKFVYGTTPIPASLRAVVKKYGGGAEHATKQVMHQAMEEDETFWDKRPIPKIALDYASTDVIILNDVYEKLCKYITGQRRLECLGYSAIYVAEVRDSATGMRNETNEFNGAPLYGIPALDADVKVAVTKLQSEGKWKKDVKPK